MSDKTDPALDALVKRCRDENASGYECAEAITALRAERDAWKAQCEAVEREAAKCFSAQEEIDAAWDAFGTSGNRKVLSLAEQIASHQREVDDARAAYARGVQAAAAHVVAEAVRLCEGMENADAAMQFMAELADEIRALASAPPAPVVRVKPHAIEREIWQAMAWALRHAKRLPGDIMPAYTDTGNSDAETEARHCAARILAALQPKAEGGE